jgi:diacylglycerol kinase family enzyme
VTPADVCVIYNPAAGRGRALRRLESLRRTLGTRADFQPTQSPGHAEELAWKAAQGGFSVVAAAGGDGTVHEVANGLMRAARPHVALAVYPVGSANDYAHSLGLGPEWWLRPEPSRNVGAVDVGIVETPDGRSRYFINGVGLGFNGAVTYESRRIRRLQGVFLYTAALLRALWNHYTCPPVVVTIDGDTRQTPTLALSVSIGRREGNFVLAPHAIVDDGLFDYMHAGPIPRWELLRYVPGMISGNLPVGHPALWMGRCRQVTVHSEAALPVHLDGELFSPPGGDLHDLDIRILPAALRVLGHESKRLVTK